MIEYNRPSLIGITAVIVMGHSNNIVVSGLLIITLFSLFVGIATIVRYLINRYIYMQKLYEI